MFVACKFIMLLKSYLCAWPLCTLITVALLSLGDTLSNYV